MTTEPTSISARNLVVPIGTSERRQDELLQALRKLDLECRLNGVKRDSRVIVLIDACIDGEINTGKRIVAVLRQLGFNARYVGMTLKMETGNDPNSYRWRKNDGIYSCHRHS